VATKSALFCKITKKNFSERCNSKNMSHSQKMLQAKIIYALSSMRPKRLTALGHAVWSPGGDKNVALKKTKKNSAANTAKTAHKISIAIVALVSSTIRLSEKA
jgi:hypothetical protein